MLSKKEKEILGLGRLAGLFFVLSVFLGVGAMSPKHFPLFGGSPVEYVIFSAVCFLASILFEIAAHYIPKDRS